MPYIPGASELTDGVPDVWYPIDQNLITWSADPASASSTYTLATAGTSYVIALKTNATTVTNVLYNVSTAGATLTTGQCFVGLYQNAVLLGSSADQKSAWGSTGLKTTALTSPVAVQEGLVYVAFVFNGTTGPTLTAGGTVGNMGLSATISRYGTAATGSTTALPAAMGTVAALAASPLVGLS